MCFAVPLFLRVTKTYEGLSVTPQYFYTYCCNLISHALDSCMVGAGVLFAAMVVLIVVCARLRKSALHRHHTGHDF